jgi:hypothetical protein
MVMINGLFVVGLLTFYTLTFLALTFSPLTICLYPVRLVIAIRETCTSEPCEWRTLGMADSRDGGLPRTETAFDVLKAAGRTIRYR